MAVKVRSRKFFFQVIYYTPYRKSSSVKCVFSQRSSWVVFRQRSSSAKGRLPSKIVSRQRSSSIKGCLLSRFSSSFGSLLLGFSPGCGIAQLSLSLFLSSSWSTSITFIIFRCVSISRTRPVIHSLSQSIHHIRWIFRQ